MIDTKILDVEKILENFSSIDSSELERYLKEIYTERSDYAYKKVLESEGKLEIEPTTNIYPEEVVKYLEFDKKQMQLQLAFIIKLIDEDKGDKEYYSHPLLGYIRRIANLDNLAKESILLGFIDEDCKNLPTKRFDGTPLIIGDFCIISEEVKLPCSICGFTVKKPNTKFVWSNDWVMNEPNK